jgi:hypothetical protein
MAKRQHCFWLLSIFLETFLSLLNHLPVKSFNNCLFNGILVPLLTLMETARKIVQNKKFVGDVSVPQQTFSKCCAYLALSVFRNLHYPVVFTLIFQRGEYILSPSKQPVMKTTHVIINPCLLFTDAKCVHHQQPSQTP